MILQRLEHWAGWLRDPKLSYFPSESPNYKIMMNTPPGGVPGDGGLYASVEKYGKLLEIDVECREVDRVVRQLPEPYRVVIHARYVTAAREPPRSERKAAETLGISTVTYRERFKLALGWLSGKLDLPIDSV